MEIKKLFEPGTINGVTVPNRVVRSATAERMADERGRCTDLHFTHYRELAEGEVGLVVTGHGYVQRGGKAGAGQISMADDEVIPGYRKLTEMVHQYDSKIMMQLNHAGRHAPPEYNPGSEVIAPSPVTSGVSGMTPREMNVHDIEQLVESYGKAAARAKACGFDGVQIHAAHGYMVNQWLSPYSNRRDDEWGGDQERRTRFAIEVLRSMRETVGPDYPVMIKMNCADFYEGGLTTVETRYIADKLCQEGIDAIEISGGIYEVFERIIRPGLLPPEEEPYYLPYADEIRDAISVPLMLVGGMRTPSVMEEILANGKADYVSMCRSLIREPNLIKQIRLGQRSAATCISCNLCLIARKKPLVKQTHPLRCEQEYLEQSKKAKKN